MSVVALHLYEKLNDAPDDKARSKAIVEAFSELEERYPDLKETATKRDLSETELRLQKEIKTIEANLQKEIQATKLEIKTVEANLQKEIEGTKLEIEKTRVEIEKVRSEIRNVETNFAKIVHKQTLWIIGAIGSIIMSIRLLEWFLTHLPH